MGASACVWSVFNGVNNGRVMFFSSGDFVGSFPFYSLVTSGKPEGLSYFFTQPLPGIQDSVSYFIGGERRTPEDRVHGRGDHTTGNVGESERIELSLPVWGIKCRRGSSYMIRGVGVPVVCKGGPESKPVIIKSVLQFAFATWFVASLC